MAKKTYYCWIRVLKVADAKGLTSAPFATNEPLPGGIRKVRPPWTATSLDRGVSDELDVWYAERDFGKPGSDVVFQCGPAFRNRKAALPWLRSREGRAWAEEADNYMLMNLELGPAPAAQHQEEQA